MLVRCEVETGSPTTREMEYIRSDRPVSRDRRQMIVLPVELIEVQWCGDSLPLLLFHWNGTSDEPCHQDLVCTLQRRGDRVQGRANNGC